MKIQNIYKATYLENIIYGKYITGHKQGIEMIPQTSIHPICA